MGLNWGSKKKPELYNFEQEEKNDEDRKSRERLDREEQKLDKKQKKIDTDFMVVASGSSMEEIIIKPSSIQGKLTK